MVYGMTISTVAGPFIIPVCHVFVQKIVERGGKQKPVVAAAVTPEKGGTH